MPTYRAINAVEIKSHRPSLLQEMELISWPERNVLKAKAAGIKLGNRTYAIIRTHQAPYIGPVMKWYSGPALSSSRRRLTARPPVGRPRCRPLAVRRRQRICQSARRWWDCFDAHDDYRAIIDAHWWLWYWLIFAQQPADDALISCMSIISMCS